MRHIGNDDSILPLAAPISGYTGSDQAFRTAYKWLEECVKGHSSLCPPLVTSQGPPQLPFRVLDVSPSDSQSVRLLETEGKVGYWACLSHCWGGKQPLITTKETLSDHKKNVPWDTLPKTFQDAVVVARAMGIQYLWIDSLCIVQDDEEDWHTQSAQMADIYQNSVLTIAGSASSGAHQGIFRKSDPAYTDSPISDTLGHTTFEKVRSRKPLVHNAAELPLLSRGWVHQERLLSPRFLHFSHNELVWECMERLTCECGRLDLADSSRAWLAPKDRFHPYSLQVVDWMKRRGPSVWHAVVSDYSRMALTRPEDIFPATSGLAKSVIKTTNWEYVAGLWKENIIMDLVWYTSNPSLASRCVPWRAPTFSWASIISRAHHGKRNTINFGYMDILRQGLEGRTDHRRTTDLYATLVEASCIPVGNDLTGRLKSGYIVLRGNLVKATLCKTAPDNKWHITAIEKPPYSHSLFSMDSNIDHEPASEQTASEGVYCLRLIGTTKHVEFEDEEFLVYLVLRPVQLKPAKPATSPEPETQTFERIGLLANHRGEIQLEDESEPENVLRDVRVKIV
jgi:hypothetical protein